MIQVEFETFQRVWRKNVIDESQGHFIAQATCKRSGHSISATVLNNHQPVAEYTGCPFKRVA